MRSILLRLHLHPSPLWVIFEIHFFRHFAAALLTAILPLYFRQFVNSDAAVGVIFFIGYLAAFCSNLFSAHIIEHLKKRKSLLLALMGFTVLFAAFATIQHTALVLIAFAVYQFMLSIFVIDIGLYLKHFSNYRQLAEDEGKMGSLGNIGWIIGPILGAFIAHAYGFHAVFLTSAAVTLIALTVFFFIRLKDEGIRFQHRARFATNIRQFFRDKNLRKTYINNAGLGFIYSIWDFLPLLMLKIGASVPIIGMTKTLMGVPQSIFEYPIGRMADRQTGERKIFIVGYLLAGVATLMLGTTDNLRLFITFFFLAATGSSFLEMTRESYFFRQMPEKEVEMIAVYRTSDTLPYLIGQGLAILTLSLLPIEWWFILGGGIGALFALNAYFLKNLWRSRTKPDSQT